MHTYGEEEEKRKNQKTNKKVKHLKSSEVKNMSRRKIEYEDEDEEEWDWEEDEEEEEEY